MKIVPTSIEEQINRVDRQRSLYIGISAAALAIWSVFRLIWALFIGMTPAVGEFGDRLFRRGIDDRNSFTRAGALATVVQHRLQRHLIPSVPP